MKQPIRIIIARVTIIIASLISSCILFRSISGGENGWAGMLFLFLNLIWLLLPYVILYFVFSIKSLPIVELVFVIITCAFSLLSVYILIDGMLIHPDAQGGLIFIFLPFYQLLAAVFLLGAKFKYRVHNK